MNSAKFFLVVNCAAIFFAAQLGFCAQDPLYKDKSLSVWVSELRDKKSSENRKEAEEAIQKLGTNALPLLLEETKNLGKLWKLNITNFYNERTNLDRLMNIRGAFKVLGPIAEPVFLELVILMNDGCLADSAAYDLSQINPEKAAVVFSNTLIQNSNFFVRCAVINNLHNLGTNAYFVIPSLVANLEMRGNDRDTLNLRLLTVSALGTIGKRPETVLPRLIQTLKDEDSFVIRAAVIKAIGAFENESKIALPLLRQISTNDLDVRVRAEAIKLTARIEKQSSLVLPK